MKIATGLLCNSIVWLSQLALAFMPPDTHGFIGISDEIEMFNLNTYVQKFAKNNFPQFEGNLSITLIGEGPTQNFTETKPTKMRPSTQQELQNSSILTSESSKRLRSQIQNNSNNQTSIFPLYWHFELNTEQAFSLDPGVKFIKVEEYFDGAQILLRLYNTATNECYSQFLRFPEISLMRHKVNESTCRRLLSVTLYKQNSTENNTPYSVNNYFTAYLDAPESLRVVALNEKIPNGGLVYQLPDFRPKNPFFQFEYLFSGDVGNQYQSALLLTLFYQKNYIKIKSLNSQLPKYIVVKGFNQDQGFYGDSNSFILPEEQSQKGFSSIQDF